MNPHRDRSALFRGNSPVSQRLCGPSSPVRRGVVDRLRRARAWFFRRLRTRFVALHSMFEVGLFLFRRGGLVVAGTIAKAEAPCSSDGPPFPSPGSLPSSGRDVIPFPVLAFPVFLPACQVSIPGRSPYRSAVFRPTSHWHRVCRPSRPIYLPVCHRRLYRACRPETLIQTGPILFPADFSAGLVTFFARLSPSCS